jgi:hypothetical protein
VVSGGKQRGCAGAHHRGGAEGARRDEAMTAKKRACRRSTWPLRPLPNWKHKSSACTTLSFNSKRSLKLRAQMSAKAVRLCASFRLPRTLTAIFSPLERHLGRAEERERDATNALATALAQRKTTEAQLAEAKGQS